MNLFILSFLLLFGTVSVVPFSNENGKLKLQSNPVCKSKSPVDNFSQQNITVAFLVQQSKELTTTLFEMKSVADKVAKDLQASSPGWIGHLNYWMFDDKMTMPTGYSNDTVSIPGQIDDFIRLVKNTGSICKNLKVLEALILTLTDPTATQNMQIFVYVSGGLKYDVKTQKRLYELIDKLTPKIHVIQHGPVKCYNMYDPAIITLEAITYYSGGTYSLSGSGLSLKALPLQYNAAKIYDDARQKCARRQSYQFYVDSETTSLSLRLSGDIKEGATFLAPNSKATFTPTKVFTGQFDRLYTITKENLKSTDDLLPAGIWLVNFDVYADEEVPCSLRVDAQSKLQLYRRFVYDIDSDYGNSSATYGSDKNRQIIHLESSAQDTSKLSVNFARFYSSNTEDLIFTTSVSARDNCTYQFVSEPFNATQFAYTVQYTGIDAQGQRFRRILPVTALSEM